MNVKDFKNRLCNIAVHTIWWSRMKYYCDLDSGFGDQYQYQKILAKEMPDKTAKAIKEDWKRIKAITNECVSATKGHAKLLWYVLLCHSSVLLLTSTVSNHANKDFLDLMGEQELSDHGVYWRFDFLQLE